MYSDRLGIILQISLYNAMGLNDDGEEHTHAHTSQRRCKVYFTISAAVKSRITDTNRCFQDEKQSQIFAPVGLCVSHAEDPLAGAHEEDQNHVDQQQNGDHSEHRHRLHVQGHAAVLLSNLRSAQLSVHPAAQMYIKHDTPAASQAPASRLPRAEPLRARTWDAR